MAKETRLHKKDIELTVVRLAPNLPIVMCILLKTNYIMNLMESPMINTVLSMAVRPMAQRVAINHCLIAGRLSLFSQNWEIITKDQWVLNTIQGYTMELLCQPYQLHPPAELAFSRSETEDLTQEVHKMVTKQAVSQIPREQANKGFISQLFSVPKKEGGMRPTINLKSLNTFVETKWRASIC